MNYGEKVKALENQLIPYAVKTYINQKANSP